STARYATRNPISASANKYPAARPACGNQNSAAADPAKRTLRLQVNARGNGPHNRTPGINSYKVHSPSPHASGRTTGARMDVGKSKYGVPNNAKSEQPT